MPTSSDPPDSTMPRHPIGVVAQRTGLTQDVIRIWERRYAVVQPGRGAGGHRLYSDQDIERLSLLHAATSAGRNISQVADLPTEAIALLVEQDVEAGRRREPSPAAPDAGAIVETALERTRELDATQLDEALRRAAALLGLSAFIESVAVPVLRRVGDDWHAGRLTPAQEHLASSVLHDIIADTMRAFAHRNGAPRIVVATPAGERHVIGAALVGAAAAVQGWNVIYLGADLPASDIATAARLADARVVAVSIVYVDDRERLLDELRVLRARLPHAIPLVAGGAGARQLGAELGASGIRVVAALSDLEPELRAAGVTSGG
jgi:DNA-binding transcriptional MerR regulator/methylmalonyl-CoA mutase cobalamin-binding subunit